MLDIPILVLAAFIYIYAVKPILWDICGIRVLIQ